MAPIFLVILIFRNSTGGVPIDMGAEFVHGEGNNSVYELVSPYDLLVSYSTMHETNMITFANTSGYIFNSSHVNPLVWGAYKIFDEEEVQHFNGSMAGYFYPRYTPSCNCIIHTKSYNTIQVFNLFI